MVEVAAPSRKDLSMATSVPGTDPAEQQLPLKKTALNATHRALKAKMVDFGGWDMPVEYPVPRRRPDRRAHGRAHRRRPL